MMPVMALLMLTISCLVMPSLGSESGTDVTEIYSLIQKQEYRAAQQLAEAVLEAAPDNITAKYLLGFVLASVEGGDLARAVSLALEVATWPEAEVSRDLRERAASLALDAAVNSGEDEMIKLSAEAIISHQLEHGQFGDKIMQDAVTLAAELLSAAGEFEEARSLLSSGLVAETSLELDLLRLFYLKLEERRQNIEETSESRSLLDSLKLLTYDDARQEEVEEPKMLVRRLAEKWRGRGAELEVEGDVMMGIMVELGIFPSKRQKPAWCDRNLTSRCHTDSIDCLSLVL